MDIQPASQPRPQHRRNASSKSNILRSIISPKARAVSPTRPHQSQRTKSAPFLPSDHPHTMNKKPLGERQGNVQTPPSSPSKSRSKNTSMPVNIKEDVATRVPTKTMDGAASPKKSMSSTNISSMFAKINRSSKDLAVVAPKDKENSTPPSSSNGHPETPIWSQFSSRDRRASRPSTRDSKSSSINEEIDRYTPQNYSPSKQRNFDATRDQPSLRPTLNSRPKSAYVLGTEGLAAAIGRTLSSRRPSVESRHSEDSSRLRDQQASRRTSGGPPIMARVHSGERKVSGSSTEQAPVKEKLNIAKRGGRVMAAVAAFQGKTKDQLLSTGVTLDPKAVDVAFEAVLDARNIPEPMRQKMRCLTLRVKADFVKQDQGLKEPTSSPTTTTPEHDAPIPADFATPVEDDNSKATKRSRPRSRTFTFSRADKKIAASSPPKKQRSQSRSRPTSILIPSDTQIETKRTTSSPFGSLGRKSAATAIPLDYITYLRTHADPTKPEVGRLHKLRILLRNETVAWVDSFVSLGGMGEIVALLHRIMGIEWREEHEDQLLHETLLCLKGLCTTERAMRGLEEVADTLFPALVGMLFDEEKKGPAEYTTRTVIINLLFAFLSSASSSPDLLQQRSQRILSYLGEPAQPPSARPVDFVLDMHTPRPYRLWSREVANVTKEVFWIFLHHLNAVPLPSSSVEEGATSTSSSYTLRHFPGLRAPVPAAPYIGGVEWDATTYLSSHLDLLNGLIASLPTDSARNSLREELRASGWEKTMGATLRTCKEKFYSGVHDGLRAWVAAAAEDGWESRYVREGPGEADRGRGSPRKSPVKKRGEEAPQLEAPKLELGLGIGIVVAEVGHGGAGSNDDEGWLG